MTKFCLSLLFLLSLLQIASAADAKAIALLKGVEQERMRCECFRIRYVEHRAEENGKTVEQIVDFDRGKIRKNHLPNEKFQGMKSLLLGDVFYLQTSYDEKNICLLSSDSPFASGSDTYDPRVIGLTEFHVSSTSVQDCLLRRPRRDNFSCSLASLNGNSVWRVTCQDNHPDYTAHWEFFIEEPSFHLLRKTCRSQYAEIQIDNDYSDDKMLPFPTIVKAIRKEGKTEKKVTLDRTITVKEVEIKQSFPPETFTLASFNLPLNTDIIDHRINRRLGYWDGEKLVDAPVRISAQEQRELEEKFNNPRSLGIARVVLISTGALLIAFAIFFMIRKKR